MSQKPASDAAPSLRGVGPKGNTVLVSSADAGDKLIELIKALRKSPIGRSAVHLRLSALLEGAAQASDCEAARGAVIEWAEKHGGTAFALFNNDVVGISKGARGEELRQLAERIEALFKGVPRNTDEAPDAKTCRWYDLSAELPVLLDVCDRIQLEKRAYDQAVAERRAWLAEGGLPVVTPSIMARLEEALQRADIDRFLRQQPICKLKTGNMWSPEPCGREVYVRIREIERIMMPGVDLIGDEWLFLYMTSLLDQRVLTHFLREPDSLCRQPTWLNLRLSSVLSADFGRLVRLLSESDRRKLTVELQSVDLMAAYDEFLFARSFLNDIGVKLCLDGVDDIGLPVLVEAKIGVDMIKIKWTPDSDGQMQVEPGGEFARALNEYGPTRVVLCHCSDRNALKFGHRLGITLFQGRFLDQLLSPTATRIN
ncbi:MAG: EAL domain-containing protein [Alphaproteobacteria bacterium]|nr:EAL domain-containing protein [Alphaproteobacteria bacterium]